jgi:glyoxylase-like metal-dependent hydrolase (beta-lactamase superfamily II)
VIRATLNSDNLVERVETRSDNPVLGDIVTETLYSGYRDAKQISLTPVHPEDLTGVMFPTHIVQKQGGFPALDLTVTSARPNAYMVFPMPDAIKRAATQPLAPAAPPRVDVQKISDGVYYLTGGTHHSLAVEFKNYVAVFEAPLDETRVVAVMAEVRKTVPNKPIRYVVNSHHHFDHSGGLRAAVAGGAVIITQAANKPYYEKVWALPHTIVADRMAKSGRKPSIEGVLDKRILTDGNRTLELYKLQGTDHADTMLIGYLPREKLLVEADVFNPPPPNAPPGQPNKEAANLIDNIQRLKLDVQQIAPLHGRVTKMDELMAAAGRGRRATR